MPRCEPHCCYADEHGNTCPKPAEFVIWTVTPSEGSDHDTHACREHVGPMLDETREHVIYPIGTVVDA